MFRAHRSHGVADSLVGGGLMAPYSGGRAERVEKQWPCF